MQILTDGFEHVPLARLLVHPENPNVGNLEQIVESVSASGFWGTVVANRRTGHILAGNHRYLAAQRLGADTVPVAWGDVDDEAERRILVADNRIATFGQINAERLDAILSDLLSTPIGLRGTGFTDDEVAALRREQLGRGVQPGADVDDAPPVPPTPVTQPGDVYTLGAHRLVCGDATDAGAWAALMGTERADAVLTDPPYNVAYTGGALGNRTAIANDAMPEADFQAFLSRVFARVAAATRLGAPWYIFHADTQRKPTVAAAAAAGFSHRQTLVWCKDQFVMGRQDYHWQHEPALYGWLPGGRVRPMAGASGVRSGDEGVLYVEDHTPVLYGWLSGGPHKWHGDRRQKTVLTFERPKASKEHPTMKPVALLAQLLQNSTARGAIVVDCFGGSGSTLIACEQEGRAARCLELEPGYCDVIVRRWEAVTGQRAVRASREAYGA